MIIYESPYRLLKTLQQLAQVMGEERPAAVCREISKRFAETQRGTLAELIGHFTEVEPKGEIVLIVGGASEGPKEKKIHRNKYKNINQNEEQDEED